MKRLRGLLCVVAFAVLAGPVFGQAPATPSPVSAPVILTPPAPDTPRINGPKVFGVRPGSPFLYSIPATGKRPMQFSVDDLPAGLKVDSATGQITGTIATAGNYKVTFHAQNALGTDSREFKIVAGNQLALTPPMGWNSWNAWGEKIDQDKVEAAAKAMASSGLKDHGWTYVNIDDGWQGIRGGPFNGIQSNTKFPDMAALGNVIHGLGLKMGIYSTPWRGAYSGHVGSSCDNEDGTYNWVKSGDYQEYYIYPKVRNPEHPKDNYVFGKYPFLKQDAQQWTAWGVDYLKYDWYPCKNINEITPMHDVLQSMPRDIVFSLSNRLPFQMADQLGKISNLWRTSYDIDDSWNSLKSIVFLKYKVPNPEDKWAPFQGPGYYPDPDMLVVGWVSWGRTPRPSKLTPDEQYLHMSFWCLFGAPLLLGCDLTKLDDFTLSLLTNDEVLAVDQDSLCKMATRVGGANDTADLQVYAKPLEDGSLAVGLFNFGETPAPVTMQWGDLGITGRQTVRDLWRQKDLGVFNGSYQAPVINPHGVVLLRVIPAGR